MTSCLCGIDEGQGVGIANHGELKMKNWGGRIVLMAVIVVLAQGCVSTDRFSAASQEIENQDQVIQKLEVDRKQLQDENAKLRNLNDMAQLELERAVSIAAPGGVPADRDPAGILDA